MEKENRKNMCISMAPRIRLLGECAADIRGVSWSHFLELATEAYVANLPETSRKILDALVEERLNKGGERKRKKTTRPT